MVAILVLLPVGIAAIVYTVQAIQHAGNAAKYGPAGGLHNYQSSLTFLSIMVFVVAAIVGSTAGAQDIETGVFRDLVATGASRLALFAARIPGALAIHRRRREHGADSDQHCHRPRNHERSSQHPRDVGRVGRRVEHCSASRWVTAPKGVSGHTPRPQRTNARHRCR